MKKNLQFIIIALISIVAIILICCAIALINNYDKGLDKQAIDAANHYSERWEELINDTTDYFVQDAQTIAKDLPNGDSEAVSYLSEWTNPETATMQRHFRFFCGDEEFDEYGYPFEASNESEIILNLNKNGKLAVSGIVNDSVWKMAFFTVYVPIEGNNDVDGLLVMYYVDSLRSMLSVSMEEEEYIPSFLAACSNDGYMFYKMYEDDDEEIGRYDNNIFSELIRLTNDKNQISEIQTATNFGKTYTVNIGGDIFALTVSPSDNSDNCMYIVSLYNVHEVYAEGHGLASTMSAVIVTVMIIIVTLSAYIIVARIGTAIAANRIAMTDSKFGCPNLLNFTKHTETVLEESNMENYAVVYSEVAHFSYIGEHYGTGTADASLKYLIKVFEKNLLDKEYFGRINDDHFVLLVNYTSTSNLEAKIKKLSSVASMCPELKAHNYYLKLDFGMYLVTTETRSEKLSVQTMIDRAIIAKRSANNKGELPIYSEKIHQAVMHEGEIESKMEAALKNGEFKLFYQPKYLITGNRPDGCEALVRWYDPQNNRFRPPSEFLPLFEANGFIAELDKYVFTEVCKFVNDVRERGYRLVPISVNVSRVTATQENFLDYYIATKKKYNIVDNFLTIEFSESFAYENYDTINNILNKFHQNGFKCCIDDFGSGFSSFNILKEIRMDEIKLDRFFIKPGISQERDNKLLSAIVSLAKSLNMKVGQSGVETIDDLNRLRDMGCDFIQGYIYARPLPATDFLEFINSGGKIVVV